MFLYRTVSCGLPLSHQHASVFDTFLYLFMYIIVGRVSCGQTAHIHTNQGFWVWWQQHQTYKLVQTSHVMPFLSSTNFQLLIHVNRYSSWISSTVMVSSQQAIYIHTYQGFSDVISTLTVMHWCKHLLSCYICPSHIIYSHLVE